MDKSNQVNLREVAAPGQASTQSLVLQCLNSYKRKYFRYHDLVRETGRDGNQLKWSLFRLTAKGMIEAIGDPSNASFLRYRLKRAVHGRPSLPGLRQVSGQLLLGDGQPASSPKPQTTQNNVVTRNPASADLLVSWLTSYCKSHETDSVATRHVLRCGPSSMRDKASLTTALLDLAAMGRVTLMQDGLKRLVKINDAIPTGKTE